MRRALPAILALAALTVAVAGCGGGTAKERALTGDDLVSVVGPAPDTPAGVSYADTGQPTDLNLAGLRAHAQTAADRATVARLERAGLTRLYQRSFDAGSNIADGTAYHFLAVAGARTAYLDLQTALKQQAGPGQKLTDVAANGIGDEAWGAHLTGGSEAALFLSRIANVVVVADMSCDTDCGLDIVSAARSYVEAMATRASQAAG